MFTNTRKSVNKLINSLLESDSQQFASACARQIVLQEKLFRNQRADWCSKKRVVISISGKYEQICILAFIHLHTYICLYVSVPKCIFQRPFKRNAYSGYTALEFSWETYRTFHVRLLMSFMRKCRVMWLCGFWCWHRWISCMFGWFVDFVKFLVKLFYNNRWQSRMLIDLGE